LKPLQKIYKRHSFFPQMGLFYSSTSGTLTTHIHRAAVKRQTQSGRGRGGIGLLGRFPWSSWQSFH
jgi:hypothetical protein